MKPQPARPCTNSKCQYPTRSSRQTLETHPGTRQRRLGGLCANCFHAQAKADTPPAAREAEQESPFARPGTIRGLEAFLRARETRLEAAARRHNPYRRTA